jgi:LysM repeat protein
MARKSKGKFNMKGHSIPGIKGFKNTTLEDGRAASSAFQMQSPLHEEDDGSDAYELDDINIKSSDYDPNRAEKQAAGQSGLGYMGQEFGKLEWRDGKLVRKGSEVKEEKDEITKQVDKYDSDAEGAEGTYAEYKTEMEGMGIEPMSAAAWTEQNSQNQGYQSEVIGHQEDETQMKDKYVDENAPAEEVVEVPVEETTSSYEVQGGDNLSKIARANNMTLEELLEKNPEYKANPSFVKKGATLNL